MLRKVGIVAATAAFFLWALVACAGEGVLGDTAPDPGVTVLPTSTPTTVRQVITPTATRPVYAAADGWSGEAREMAVLLGELFEFKDDPLFHVYCFGESSPYRYWYDRVMTLDEHGDQVEAFRETGLIPVQLWQMGLEFCNNDGGVTAFALQLVRNMEQDWANYVTEQDALANALGSRRTEPTPVRLRRPTPQPTATPTPAPTPTATPEPLDVEPMVVSGRDSVCFLHGDGRVDCSFFDRGWYEFSPEGRFRHVSVGDQTLCAISAENWIHCEGDYIYEIVDGRFSYVDTNGFSVCGVTDTDGRIRCWNPNQEWPTPDEDGFKAVELGGTFACGLKTDGDALCWTWNDGTPRVLSDRAFRQISAGQHYACGVGEDGGLACAFDDGNPPPGTFIWVEVGTFEICGLTAEGKPLCWWPSDGTIREDVPMGPFMRISLGNPYSCGIDAYGEATCWDSRPADYGGKREPVIKVSLQKGQ